MTAPPAFVVPGRLDAASGGSVYDRRIVEGLRAAGRPVEVVELPGTYPQPDAAGRVAADAALAALADGTTAVVDGLCLGALPEVAARHAGRLRLVALVHHPLAEETGVPPAEAARLAADETAALAHAARVIVTSPFTARRLTAAYGVPESRLHVVTPGVDPAPPARGSGGAGPARLLCVASFIPRKGHDDLLHALARLSGGPAWHLACVGRTDIAPETWRAVRALRDELGLADRVALRGPVEAAALAALHDGADLAVLPSHYEGYGMAVTEALARGLPVVTTTGGALADTLPPGAGIAVPPGDVAALADALGAALAPARHAELAAGARAARAELADWPAAAAAFAAALDAAGAPA